MSPSYIQINIEQSLLDGLMTYDFMSFSTVFQNDGRKESQTALVSSFLVRYGKLGLFPL